MQKETAAGEKTFLVVGSAKSGGGVDEVDWCDTDAFAVVEVKVGDAENRCGIGGCNSAVGCGYDAASRVLLFRPASTGAAASVDCNLKPSELLLGLVGFRETNPGFDYCPTAGWLSRRRTTYLGIGPFLCPCRREKQLATSLKKMNEFLSHVLQASKELLSGFAQ